MLYTVCWGFIFLRYVVCGIWLIVCHLRVSLFKVSLVVWLMFACFCSYWNNWNLLSHYFNVMCFEVEGRCGMEWRRVQSLRWWIAAHRRGVPITVHLERGVSQKRQNRLTYGTSGKHELSTEDCIFFFFFQNGRERWFWEAEAFPFPTTRAGEVGLSSPPADTRVRWGSGQKIIAQPLQLHSRPINFSWALLWTFTSGKKKGKIWLKDDRFCKHLSDCVYKWFKLLFIFTRHWTPTCLTFSLSCGKKATVACVLWVHTEAYLISELIALRYLQMLYITL